MSRKGSTDTYDMYHNMDEPWNHYVKDKSDTKGHTLWFYLHEMSR